MPKYSVSTSDSAQYVVPAKNILGAIKSALPVIESNEPEKLAGSVLTLRIAQIVPKEKVQ
jgi:hypothetical protein